jgi:hypothetical protein
MIYRDVIDYMLHCYGMYLNNLLSQGTYLNNLLSQGTYLKKHIRVRGRNKTIESGRGRNRKSLCCWVRNRINKYL